MGRPLRRHRSRHPLAAPDRPGYTWTTDNPAASAEIGHIVGQPGHRRRLDYVFTGSWHAHPRAHCRIRDASLAFDQPVGGTWPSDHYGVVADLEIGSDA